MGGEYFPALTVLRSAMVRRFCIALRFTFEFVFLIYLFLVCLFCRYRA